MLKIDVIPVTPIMQNCRLVQCSTTGEAVIVDPGGDVDTILMRIASTNANVQQIWVTHCHFDHVGGVSDLAAELNIPIIGSHINDEPMLSLLSPLSEQMLGVKVKSYTPDRWLVEGDELNFGTASFKVIFTPGHCPGHVVFYSEGEQILIGGDVLFQGSIGRTDLPGCNHNDLITAIRNKLFKLPPDTEVLPGHGPNTTLSAERLNNPFVADSLFK